MVPNEKLAVMLPEPASASFSVQLKAVLQEITAQARLGDRAFTKQKLRLGVRARVAARTVNCFDPGRFERFIRECSGEIAEFYWNFRYGCRVTRSIVPVRGIHCGVISVSRGVISHVFLTSSRGGHSSRG